MRRLLTFTLFMAIGMSAQTTIPSAALPNPTDSTDLTSNEITLINTATAGGTCHAGTHIWCAHNTSGTNLGNGTNYKTAFGHHGDANGVSATGNIETGNTPDAEIIVVDANDGNPTHQYESGGGGAPFATGSGGCIGNNTNGFSDGGCNFYLGPLVQPDVTHVKPIITVTSHYSSLTPEHQRVIPVNGDGSFSPQGQVRTVLPTDFATFQTTTANPIMYLSQNDTNGVRFIGIEFTTINTNCASAGICSYAGGFSFGMVRAQGAGITGSRNLFIKDGTVPTYLAVAIRIEGTDASVPGQPVDDFPVISEAHVVPSTPCTQTWNLQLPAGVPQLVCFVGIGTHWAAGRSEITLHFNAKNWPASDAVVNALSSGAGSGQCAAGATQAGNGVLGNLCVVDATHAYTSITLNAVSPGNGGIHPYVIDTAPVGGDLYTAGTEHSITTDALQTQYPQTWSLTCVTCTIPITNGVAFIPTNNVPQIFHAIGTSTGPNATNWTSAHVFTFTQGQRCTALNTPVTGCIAPVNNSVPGGLQELDFGWINSATVSSGFAGTSGAPSFEMSALIIINSSFQFNDNVVPGKELDVAYKIGQQFYGVAGSTEAIDHCGPSRFETNYVVRGKTYTLDCFGVQTNWSGAQLNCSGTCNTANLNFGSNITINTVNVISTTHLTVNFTVQGNAETGARHVVFDRTWFHGADGQIYDNSSTPTNLIPCTTAAGSTQVNNHCYVVNAQETTQGLVLEGGHDAAIDSYFNAIHNHTFDSQAIGSTVGTGPCLIRNNFASSATENIFYGGGGGNMYNNSFSVSSDCQVDHNYMYKPPIWDNYGVGDSPGNCSTTYTTATGTHFGCVWSVKDDYESKGCLRCWVHDNVMENNWIGAVTIYQSIVMTPRNAQGGSGGSIDDMTIENNLIVGGHNNTSLTGFDVNSGYGINNTIEAGAENSVESRRVIIRNNLTTPNQNQTSTGGVKNTSVYLDFPQDVLIQHNTILPETGITMNNLNFSFGGPYMGHMNNATGCTGNIATTSRNLWMLDNVMPIGWGASSGCAPNLFMATPSTAGSDYNHRFAGNVMPKPGNGTIVDPSNYYLTLPMGGIPSVPVTQRPDYPQLDQSQPFTVDYTLNGPLPDLAPWIGPGSSKTTDGNTAGVNMAQIQSEAVFIMKGLPVVGCGPPVIQTTSLPPSAILEPYTVGLVANCGVTPYTWSVSIGSLPAGLTLNTSTGVISGTPTALATTQTFTVHLVDSSTPTPLTANQQLTLTVNPHLSITTTTLPDATVGDLYSTTIGTNGGIPPIKWSVTGQLTLCPTLTNGLCLDQNSGQIRGTPLAAGTPNFTVTATDNGNITANQALFIVINAGLSFTTITPGPGTQGVAYTYTLGVQGGDPPYTWAITSGTICAGLSLSSGGVISGMPTTPQTCSFTVTVTDSFETPNTLSAPLQITIASATNPLKVKTTSFPAGVLGFPYQGALEAQGGTPPYTWDIAPGTGSLPPGLSVTGAFITGVPVPPPGTSTFSPRVTDSLGAQAVSASPLNIIISAGSPGNVFGTNIVIGPKVVIK